MAKQREWSVVSKSEASDDRSMIVARPSGKTSPLKEKTENRLFFNCNLHFFL